MRTVRMLLGASFGMLIAALLPTTGCDLPHGETLKLNGSVGELHRGTIEHVDFPDGVRCFTYYFGHETGSISCVVVPQKER